MGWGGRGTWEMSPIICWYFRYFTEGAFDPIAVFAGLIQTAIYADFGYIVCPLLLSILFHQCLLCLSSWWGSTLRKSFEVRNSNCLHKPPACWVWSCNLAWSRKTDLDVQNGGRVSLIATVTTWKINELHVYLSPFACLIFNAARVKQCISRGTVLVWLSPRREDVGTRSDSIMQCMNVNWRIKCVTWNVKEA